ncbi:MAG: peptidoglycan DD-metalloendopeptidase family protein [Desulfosalsimonadaceae bacterium]
MRAGPGRHHQVLKVLAGGSRLRVLSRLGGWLKVSHEGDTGFVCRDKKFVRLQGDCPDAAGENDDIAAVRKELSEIEEKIEAHKSAAASCSRQERKILDALDAEERKLSKTRSNLRSVRSELDAVRGQIKKKRKQADRLEKALASERAHACRRLAALYKMRQMGEVNLLASAGSVNELMIRKAALEKILEQDQRVVARILEKKSALNSLLAELKARRSEKSELEKKRRKALLQVKQQKAERRALLEKIRSRKSSRLDTLAYLQETAARLDRVMSRLKKQSGAGREKTASFAAHQGLLNMPVEGKIKSTYGKHRQSGSGAVNFRNGIEIKSSRGTPVRAVFAGRVVYADWLKGYGNVVIIAHSNNYHTVYARAEEIFPDKGERVEAGQVIATAGDAGGLSEPALYFEVRHNGEPVNPLKWIDNR